MHSFQDEGIALVIGASGGIGAALLKEIESQLPSTPLSKVIALSRNTRPSVNLTDEASIMTCAQWVSQQGTPRLIIDATGMLYTPEHQPEKALSQINPTHMMEAFAINAVGPALLMKHLLPLLPRSGKSVFASLSAKVGSIGDNALGGWYSYRASKAALNQLIKTASVELKRRAPQSVCVALHPGTVDTKLSNPFSKTGLNVRPPEEAAKDLLSVIDQLHSSQTGGFFDYKGEPIPW
jgi:NAD(P)-dependent dehydrogenase (short-subunit alcohol dehydrogenase family)